MKAPLARATLLLVVAALLGVLAACGSDSSAGPDVVLAPNTKVLDDGARAAVTAYSQDDGTITFGQATPFTDALAVGDIVVSKTNPPAAPYGFLRKIDSIDRGGGTVVLHTEQAALPDAVQKATVRYGAPLAPIDPSQVALPPGFSVVPARATAGLHTLGIPSGRGTHIHLDHVKLSVSGSSGGGMVSSSLTLNGDVAFDAQITLNLDVDLLGVHHFQASTELDVDSSLTVEGDVQAGFDANISPVSTTLTPIDIQVGPFPIVIVPRIDVKVGVSGDVAFSLTFKETSSASVIVGARYDDGPGWQNISAANGTGGLDTPPAGKFSVDLEAYAKIDMGVYLYDVAGPYFFTKDGFEINATVPRHPFLKAGLHSQYGCGLKVDIAGMLKIADYSFSALDLFIPFYQSPNAPPLVAITSPAENASITARDRTFFEAGILDLEDGLDDENHVKATWTSDNGAVFGHGASFTSTLPNPTPGPHVVTLAVTDSDGATTTVQRTVDVGLVPSAAAIDIPVDDPSATFTAGQPYFVSGHADDPNVTSPDVCSVPGYQVTWSSDVPADVFGDPHGCPSTSVTFAPSPQQHTLTFTATGPYGEQASSSIVLGVVPPAPGSDSFLLPLSGTPYSADNGLLSAPIHFELSQPPPASLVWQATSFDAKGQKYGTAVIYTGASQTFDWAQPYSVPGLISSVLATSATGQKIHIGVYDQANPSGELGGVDIYFIYVPA